MSDSDLGGFNGPTHVPTDFNTAGPGSSKPASRRPQAGPSRTVGGGATTAARKKNTHDVMSDGEDKPHPTVKKGKPVHNQRKQETETAASDADSDVLEIDIEDIEELKTSLPNTKSRTGSKKQSPLAGRAVAPPVKGEPTNKKKGKAKSKSRAQSVEDVEHDGIEMVDDKMDVDGHGPENSNTRGERMAVHVVKNGKSVTRTEQRLREQLDQANKHISDLTEQLNELMSVRLTEPEQLMERIEAQHQSQTKVQDNLIEDLKAKLAQSDPLLRSDKTAVFELLTREEADKEMEKLQQQLKSYRDLLHERDRFIKQKDERISALEQENKELNFELKMEIERGKQFADKLADIQKQPQSVQRTNAGSILSGNKDPKMTEIIKFYEDLTNVIIPSIKTQPGRYLNTSEWLMNCCYTYKDVTDKDADPKSLMFAVRLCRDLKADESEPVESLEQLVESVHYIPRELDKETPEFVESLGFLKDTFTFERDQLSLFLRTLHDNISGEGNEKGDADASSDESVVMMK